MTTPYHERSLPDRIRYQAVEIELMDNSDARFGIADSLRELADEIEGRIDADDPEHGDEVAVSGYRFIRKRIPFSAGLVLLAAPDGIRSVVHADRLVRIPRKETT